MPVRVDNNMLGMVQQKTQDLGASRAQEEGLHNSPTPAPHGGRIDDTHLGDRIEQVGVGQDRAEQERVEQSGAGKGRAGQGRVGWVGGRARQEKAGQGGVGKSRMRWDRTEEGRAVWDTSE